MFDRKMIAKCSASRALDWHSYDDGRCSPKRCIGLECLHVTDDKSIKCASSGVRLINTLMMVGTSSRDGNWSLKELLVFGALIDFECSNLCDLMRWTEMDIKGY